MVTQTKVDIVCVSLETGNLYQRTVALPKDTPGISDADDGTSENSRRVRQEVVQIYEEIFSTLAISNTEEEVTLSLVCIAIVSCWYLYSMYLKFLFGALGCIRSTWLPHYCNLLCCALFHRTWRTVRHLGTCFYCVRIVNILYKLTFFLYIRIFLLSYFPRECPYIVVVHLWKLQAMVLQRLFLSDLFHCGSNTSTKPCWHIRSFLNSG